jgi:hypothetical protein
MSVARGTTTDSAMPNGSFGKPIATCWRTAADDLDRKRCLGIGNVRLCCVAWFRGVSGANRAPSWHYFQYVSPALLRRAKAVRVQAARNAGAEGSVRSEVGRWSMNQRLPTASVKL